MQHDLTPELSDLQQRIRGFIAAQICRPRAARPVGLTRTSAVTSST